MYSIEIRVFSLSVTDDMDDPPVYDDNKKPWRDLVVDFTQETTLHGIRFVTGQSRFTTRRYGTSSNIKISTYGSS